MPVPIGPNLGEYPAEIDHVSNGETGNQTVYRRPSIDLENRTEALRIFINAEEARLTTVSDKADDNADAITDLQSDTTPTDLAHHISNTAMHTDFASGAEAKQGTSTTKVISPATLKEVEVARQLLQYDAIVGPLSDPGTTHEHLVDALADANAGWKILITKDEFVDTTFDITHNNLEIECRRGTSFSQGLASTAFNVTANDFYISKPRFVGFTTAAININGTANRTTIRDARYNGNTNNVVDLGVATSELGQIIE